jgi:hypothetical protein
LATYREDGYLGETLFAALVRSSYGPDEEGFFPTKSELGFYFNEERLLTGKARWSEEYLRNCQQFFFEELTPAELLQHSLRPLSEQLQRQAEPFEKELSGVAFLVGEQSSSTDPISRFFEKLLLPEPEVGLRTLLQVTPDWNEEGIHKAWDELDESVRGGLQAGLFAPVAEQATQVLVALGRDLVEWKATR